MNLKYQYKYLEPLKYIDILSKPDWYITLHPLLQEYFYDRYVNKEKKPEEWHKFRQEFLILVSGLLKEGRVGLSNKTLGFDEERKKIDAIVIHHSGRDHSTPLEIFNGLHLINLYARVFSDSDKEFYGQPITSDHYYNGKQTFIGYHYIVWPDGKFEQVLKDEYIGWHCGNWGYNRRSVGVCIHDDLIEKMPTPEALKVVRKIIKKYNPKDILGHREVLSTTVCPGNLFLGENGWKKELLDDLDKL